MTSVTEPKIIIITLEDCPNCKTVKEYMIKKKMTYWELNALENTDLTSTLSLKQVPALVLLDDNNKITQVYRTFEDIMNFLTILDRKDMK